MTTVLFRVEKRMTAPARLKVLVPVAAACAALLFCALFLLLTDRSPAAVYGAMFEGALGSEYGFSETVVKAIPLILCGLGISVAFRMQVWNIGAEGQFYMGAFAATWVALTFPALPILVMLPFMLAMGMVAGALWGVLAAWLRNRFAVSELISTLMMNYIAILWVSYLVYGPWRDPKGLNFPLTAPFPEAAMLPSLGDSRVHAGLLLALVVALLLQFVFRKSRWGYEIRVIGSSPAAARYAGLDIQGNALLVMCVSGALCGLAGMVEVSGIVGKLQAGISPGYGYTAIIVAWLARLHPIAIVLVSFLFAIIQVGGFMVQTLGVPAAVATMIQGAILFFVIGADIITQYRIYRVSGDGSEVND